jgi:hypothetical protein
MKGNRFRAQSNATAAAPGRGFGLRIPHLGGWAGGLTQSLRPRQGLSGLLTRNLAFGIFLTMVALAHVWNSHYAERQARQADQMQRDLKELKSEYMTLNAFLSKHRQQSEIAPAVDTLLGLRPLSQPPYVLPVPKN